MPQSICREADIAILIARFPYIIELMVDYAGPADDKNIYDAPKLSKDECNLTIYFHLPRNLPFDHWVLLNHLLINLVIKEVRMKEFDFQTFHLL